MNGFCHKCKRFLCIKICARLKDISKQPTHLSTVYRIATLHLQKKTYSTRDIKKRQEKYEKYLSRIYILTNNNRKNCVHCISLFKIFCNL